MTALSRLPMDAPAPPLTPVTSENAAFEARAFSAWYGAKEAVRGIDLRVVPQTITAIIGPSGCGKSTFLRCLNRMHELTPGARVTGSLTCFGANLYAPAVDPVTVRRRVGMVFQKSNPFPTMTILENAVAGLRLNGIRDKRILRERGEKALRMAALWEEVKDDLHRPGISLSGGQQQRLCIARAVAMEPEVLLMDEPCSALDPISTAKVEELMQALKVRYTIVLVTHNLQQAGRCSDYTAFFYLGQLVELDRTEKIFTRPAHQQTEDYITGRFG